MFKKWRKENGQSMVEFAIILPVLLAIICAIMDFGWLFYNQFALTNSAREGARFAVVNVSKTSQITDKINAVAPDSLNPITITITYSNTTTPVSGDVTITLTSNVHVLTPLLGIFSNNQQRPIGATVTMKCESTGTT